jgi:hypothetical protein
MEESDFPVFKSGWRKTCKVLSKLGVCVKLNAYGRLVTDKGSYGYHVCYLCSLYPWLPFVLSSERSE